MTYKILTLVIWRLIKTIIQTPQKLKHVIQCLEHSRVIIIGVVILLVYLLPFDRAGDLAGKCGTIIINTAIPQVKRFYERPSFSVHLHVHYFSWNLPLVPPLI